ncbi:lipoprotein [Xanthomonas fragariae]|nr:lipoprotein [Xanthomonas fragariae]
MRVRTTPPLWHRVELGQTIFEEEILRDVKVSGPTRVRRYLSRFFVVIVIALAIETLVSIFELMHEGPAKLPYAAAVGLRAALLLIAWGVFVKLNRSAEELEPEAMEETKREDRQIQE